jgi:hypothetical protein
MALHAEELGHFDSSREEIIAIFLIIGGKAKFDSPYRGNRSEIPNLQSLLICKANCPPQRTLRKLFPENELR